MDLSLPALPFFEGKVTFDADAAGTVIIPAGETEVEITFENPYPVAPIVTVSPNQKLEASFYVTDVTENGFILNIDPSTDEDVEFSWHAIVTAAE